MESLIKRAKTSPTPPPCTSAPRTRSPSSPLHPETTARRSRRRCSTRRQSSHSGSRPIMAMFPTCQDRNNTARQSWTSTRRSESPGLRMGQRTNIPSDPQPAKPGPRRTLPKKCMQDAGPKFTMARRLKEMTKSSVPGPGTYSIPAPEVYLEKGPAYSIARRTELPTDKFPRPNPNTYSPDKFMQESGPKWTMAPRLKGTGNSNVPGPGTYEVGNLDAYLEKQPAYTMRPKTQLPTDKSPKPSPNTYEPEKCMQDDGPSWTMAPRLEDIKKMNVPGPGTYESGDLDMYLEKRPVYSMRPKTELPRDKTPKPSPNAYNPEKYNPDEGPKWTLATRLVDPKGLNVPGPGTYEAGDLDVFQDKQPVYSMRPKTELPRDKTPKPSPNAYRPEEVYIESHFFCFVFFLLVCIYF
ncbi:UNVERIFIED_CONTAM: hypothetical protein GTU68_021985 [Idotea baltica]|nr:hypothetical protein [Idotea baltica]